MKVILVLFVIVVAIVAAVVHFGGLTAGDPKAEMEQFKSSVKEGMSWEEVAALRKPKKYQTFGEGFGGLAPAQDFNPDQIRRQVEEGNFESGFFFTYSFAADAVYDVHFDEKGMHTHMEKARTASDLLSP